MDYRKLLIKYINYVGDMEGTSFISPIDSRPFDFTQEEWEELVELDRVSRELEGK